MTTLRESILALCPAGTHEGEAPTGARLPWTVVVLDVPTPSARALAGQPHAYRVRLRGTAAGASAHAASIVADKLRLALEGARPVADGWVCSPLRHVSSRPVARDPQVTWPATDTHTFFAVLDFEATASPTPVEEP